MPVLCHSSLKSPGSSSKTPHKRSVAEVRLSDVEPFDLQYGVQYERTCYCLKIECGLSLMYISSFPEICMCYGFEDSVLVVVVINFTCICNVQCGHFCPKPQKLLYHNSPSTTLIPFPIPVSLKGGSPESQEMLFLSHPIPNKFHCCHPREGGINYG